MTVDELEPGLDELFQKLNPNGLKWEGANEDEIRQIDELIQTTTDYQMPDFYRWFLSRMGRSCEYELGTMDCRVSTIVEWHDEDFAEELLEDESDLRNVFKIGITSEYLGYDLYYDFAKSVRDDALIQVSTGRRGGLSQRDTFREALVDLEARIHTSSNFPNHCDCLITSQEDDIMPIIDPLFLSLGFTKVGFRSGTEFALYEKDTAFLVASTSYLVGSKHGHFSVGGTEKDLETTISAITNEPTLVGEYGINA